MSAKEPKNLPPPPVKFAILPKVINGGIAGIIGVSVVFPLDLVKTRLQNQTVGPNGEKQYKNMIDCFKQTYAREGYFGMYRGSAVNIILVTPEKAIKLSANDMFRYYLTLPNGTLPIPRQMLAGAMAGACQIVVTTPMELLKIQMQDSGRVAAEASKGIYKPTLGHFTPPDGKQKVEAKSSYHYSMVKVNMTWFLSPYSKDPGSNEGGNTCTEGKVIPKVTAMMLTKKLLAERGIFGLYKGITLTAARDISFSIIYFPLFATLAEQGAQPGVPPSFWWNFGSGCLAGSSAAWAVTPWDVLKTRIQASSKEQKGGSAFQIFSETMKNEGVTAFFKGGACRMMVVAPLFGVAQAVYYIGIAETLFGL